MTIQTATGMQDVLAYHYLQEPTSLPSRRKHWCGRATGAVPGCIVRLILPLAVMAPEPCNRTGLAAVTAAEWL
jgi:hypothetical protein